MIASRFVGHRVKGLIMSMFKKVEPIIEAAKKAASDYYCLTGKPLGITGEVGEYLAAKHLGLELAGARAPGLDAHDSAGRRIQIKSRAIPEKSFCKNKPSGGGQMGVIRFDYEWDVVMLVLMTQKFELRIIYEAERDIIEEALQKPGSKARNERGRLAVSKFISIGKQVWPAR